MLQYTIFVAVAVAGYTGASAWAVLCGIAALSFAAIAGETVMTRVLATGDDDVLHFSLHQIMTQACWASSVAFALGAVVKTVGG